MNRKVLILISFLCLGSSLAFSQSKTYAFKAGYNITCRVERKVIVENSDFLILDTNGDTVVAGVVKSVSPLLVITGDHFFWEGEQKVKATGDFSIINSSAGTFILNEKKGEALKIRPQNVVSAFFETKTKTVNYSDPDGTSMLMRTQWQPSDSEDYYKKESLTVRIKNTLLSEYGYTDTDALLEHTPSGYDFVWTHGHRFIGDILCKQDENGIFYHLGLGKDIMPKIIQTLEISESPGFYTYTRESVNDPDAPITKMVIEVPESVIQRNGYWNTVALISGGEKGTFVYRNGEVFEGKYSALVQNGGIASLTICQGTYRWPSGDVFTGDYSGRFVGGVPIDGELTLSTGQAPLDKWWEKYKMSQEAWDNFSKLSTPTEKFAYAMQVFAVDIINEKIKEINKYIENDAYDKALAILDEYEDIASTTEVATTWVKTKKELIDYRMDRIFNLLVQGKFDSALKMKKATTVHKRNYRGDHEYRGDMSFGAYFSQHHGKAVYKYRLDSDGLSRIYDGNFEYSDGSLFVNGFFSNGKRDGEWIVIDKSESSYTVLLAVYNQGVHDGAIKYAYVSNQYGLTYYYENELSNGRFSGTYRTGDNRHELTGSFKDGYPTGVWKDTFKRNNPLFYRSDVSDTHYADFSISSTNPKLYGFNEGTGQKYEIDALINEYTKMDHMTFLQFEDNLPGPEHSYNKINPIIVQKN